LDDVTNLQIKQGQLTVRRNLMTGLRLPTLHPDVSNDRQQQKQQDH